MSFKGGIGVQPVARLTTNEDGTLNVFRNVVKTVSPAGAWKIADLRATITTNGVIEISGKGLLLAAGNGIGTTGNNRVFATLTCEPLDGVVLRSTDAAGVQLEPNGDFRIADTLNPAPPPECESPVLLIRSTANGQWFAAGIRKLGGEDDN